MNNSMAEKHRNKDNHSNQYSIGNIAITQSALDCLGKDEYTFSSMQLSFS
jgi:hypothetical protein